MSSASPGPFDRAGQPEPPTRNGSGGHMRYRLFASVIAFLLIVSLALVGAAGGWTPPRTPWGEPDLQGASSTDDDTGTPRDRPSESAGRTLSDISPSEMKEINRRRTTQFNAGVSGDEF